jgi:SAM-dependent methyltransferase
MTFSQYDIEYFKRGSYENPRFWARFGGKPDFTDSFVVDLGCGHGSLCVDIAYSSPKKVIGLDLDANHIAFAKDNLNLNYPDLAKTIEFRLQDLRVMSESGIDFFVSKDTFEHVIELEQVLAEMKVRLNPGGRIYTGFGPLWNSPYGDHSRTKMQSLGPWGHLLLDKKRMVERLNLRYHKDILSIYDLGINTLSFADYLRIFNASGLKIKYLKVNANEGSPKHLRSVISLFSLLRKIPFLTEFLTYNIFAVLEKEHVQSW